MKYSPAARASNDADLLASGDAETEVIEDRLSVDVFEAHVLEFYRR